MLILNENGKYLKIEHSINDKLPKNWKKKMLNKISFIAGIITIIIGSILTPLAFDTSKELLISFAIFYGAGFFLGIMGVKEKW